MSIVIFLYVLSEYIVFFGLANLFVFHNISFFEFLQSLISDFGAKFGVNIFFFILSFVGIYKLWIIKYKLRFMYVFFVFLILFHIFFNPFNNFYSSLFICLFGAVGYIIFKNRHWSNLNIKSFTLLLLFCGLLFSTISFYVRLPSFDINEDQIAFLKGIDEIEYINIEDGNIKNSFLNKKDGIFSDATILSHPKYSNFIKFYNGKVLADLNDIRIKSIDSADDQIDLLMTQNINFALKLIKKYDIDFVLVSKDMENGDLWYYRTDGLQLFFNEKFRGEKLFDLVWFNADYKLYRVEKLFFLE
ncbi:hypothetical protein HOK68_04380 [Candidatus Woesearchaeota archaeon]|nr:hypothetical protein [Candidatus Woesearchaeota archaeon]MBT6505988.1 hypothetical protein [Candidatus Woesearchaeota archaeon]